MGAGIRACTSADDAAWQALRREMYARHDVDELLAEMADMCTQPARHAQFVAIGDDEQALGFVEVSVRSDYVVGTRSSPVAFLETIFVVPDARRQGVARALVAQARAWGRARGCTEGASDALLDNVASHALHRALGFEETGRIVCFRQSLDE